METNWSAHGSKSVDEALRILRTPEELHDELERYRDVFGETHFDISNLLQLYDVQAKLLIAEHLGNAPEQLVHELAVASGKITFGIVKSV